MMEIQQKPKKKRVIRTEMEKIALTEKQIDDLLLVIKNDTKTRYSYRNYLMAYVSLLSGMRVSELVNFKIEWIEESTDNDFIHIQQNKLPYSFSPKYNSIRRIPIPKELTKKLMTYLSGRTTGYVFKSQKGKHGRMHTKPTISMFDKYFIKTISIGRKLGSHTFRRTYASHMTTADPPVPITKISIYLGHKNIQTTINYLKQIRIDEHTSAISSSYTKRLIHND